MTAPSPYLVAADRMLSEIVPGARGTWPRACAWLTRLALESALDTYWASVEPAVAECRSRRAQLLLLRERKPDLARRADYAWTALSRAGHHRGYEVALTAPELRALGAEVASIVAALG